MTEQQRGRRSIEVGPTGQNVAKNLARLRERRGMTTRQLAGALESAGRSIPASGITRMEKGERVVTVDELTALAVVLGVSPAALLLPLTDDPLATVSVTGAGDVPVMAAWDWADGRGPLQFDPRRRRETQRMEFALYGRPPWQHPDWRGAPWDVSEGDGFALDYDDQGKPQMVPISELRAGEADHDG